MELNPANILLGAEKLSLTLRPDQVEQLLRHAVLLLKWNQRINLTAITEPREVIEKHLLDSLAVAAHLPSGRLLDAGSGAGFPGIPIRIMRPDIDVWLVDSIEKKVAFLKSVLAELKLPGIRAQAVRLNGQPDKERLPSFDALVSRALAAPADWLQLADRYRAPGGRVYCLLGSLDAAPERCGPLSRVRTVEFELPFSAARRKLVEYADPAPSVERGG